MNVRGIITAVLLSALVGTGCGAQTSNYTDHTFKSEEELAKVAGDAGIKCSLPKNEGQTNDDLSRYGYAAMPCENAAAIIYASDDARTKAHANPGNALKPGQVRLVGKNWEIVGSQYAIEAAQKKMGGRIETS